ncbi:MAG: transcription termination/antitermination protein NusA [Breznakibacter sp.]|nr:transcription termination/antitermination protein NusA [Breznakibacter sp.]
MENLNFIDTFSEFKELKSIQKPTMIRVLEDAFRSVLVKKFGTDQNFDVIINIDKGDFEIIRNREVVEDGEVMDENLQIAFSDALKIDGETEIGEELSDIVRFHDFGRRAILSLRQNLSARILELEKENVYNKYKERIGNVITGEVYQVWKRELLVLDDEGNEMILPKHEQIPTDFYRKGDTVRAIVASVEYKNNNPLIVISRTAPEFLAKLFEAEVPEIFDGLITIKKIVRKPGERAKVAVESYDDRIDPVGACVGMKGSRIHGIVKELRNENIDVINYTSNIALYIQRALNPAKVARVDVVESKKRAMVKLNPDQVSLAIGKGGLNIRLATELTGYEIDVFKDADPNTREVDDVSLDDFGDEIEQWIIDEFKKVGFDTARDVLGLTVEELLKRTDLEEETIIDVIEILKSEFEESSDEEEEEI